MAKTIQARTPGQVIDDAIAADPSAGGVATAAVAEIESTEALKAQIADLKEQLEAAKKAKQPPTIVVKPPAPLPISRYDQSPVDFVPRVRDVTPATGSKSFFVELPDCLLGRWRINGVANEAQAFDAYKAIGGIWQHAKQPIVTECKDS